MPQDFAAQGASPVTGVISMCKKMMENYFVECFCDCFSAINYVLCNFIDTGGKWKKFPSEEFQLFFWDTFG